MILIRNGFRSALNRPFQFLSLVFFMMLSTFTFVSLEGATASVRTFVDDFARQTRQEDFFVVLLPPTPQQRREMLENNHSLIDFYEQITGQIGEAFNAVLDGRFFKDENVDDGNRLHTFRFIRETTEVNLTYLIEGHMPERVNEIAIFREYALQNNLNMGDILDINGRLFTITAFIAVPDYIYPIFSFDSPLFTPATQTLAVVVDAVYESLEGRELVLYSGMFHEPPPNMDEVIQEIGNFPGVSYSMNNQTNIRISTIDFQLTGNRLLALTFSGLLLMMSIVVLVLILKKRIQAERVQIGIFKAMGYKERAIIAGYLIYPLLASFIGALSGYFLGVGVAVNLAASYVVNFVIPTVGFYLTWRLFLLGVIVPVAVIMLATTLILWHAIKGAPVSLIQESVHLKMPAIGKRLNRFLVKCSFETRFKYSLAFRNFGKLLSLFIVVLTASMFLIFGFLAYDVVDNVTERAFGRADFRYEIKYSAFTTGEIQEDETAFLRMEAIPEFDIISVPFHLYGIDPGNNINPLYSERGENITALSREGLLINAFISRAYGVGVGDEMVLNLNNRKVAYVISGVVDHFNGAMMYLDIDLLYRELGLQSRVFNGRWSNRLPDTLEGVAYVFSMEELYHNVGVGMEMIRISLTVMVVGAVLIGSFMMLVITTFIIDENRQQISILKVMGYAEWQVSNMVLTIYFPFVVSAYLLGVFLVRAGVDLVMSQIANRLPFAIPTDFNLMQTLVGATLVVFTYWISVRISKLQLGRISLQEVLKQ